MSRSIEKFTIRGVLHQGQCSAIATLLALAVMMVIPSFAQDSNIVDIAVAAGRFETLVAVLTAGAQYTKARTHILAFSSYRKV